MAQEDSVLLLYEKTKSAISSIFQTSDFLDIKTAQWTLMRFKRADINDISNIWTFHQTNLDFLENLL